MKKRKSVKSLKNKLDKLFSEVVRREAADHKGYTWCVTCGKIAPWKELHCGHYISRSHLSTRYDEINTAPQCISCNIFKSGNMPSFTLYLQKKYGNEIVELLYKKSQEITKDYPYEQMIELYTNRLKEL